MKPKVAAAGGRRRLVDLPDPPLAPNGQVLPQGQDTGDWSPTGLVALCVLFISLVILFWLIRRSCRAEEEQETRGGGRGRRPQSNNGGGEGRTRARRQQQWALPAATAAPVTVAVDIESGQPAQPPLECTYRADESWEESTCSVCLAELAEGEALRVLMPCMHYFHTACVDEWLRKSATCPLCRAPLAAATAKGGRRRWT